MAFVAVEDLNGSVEVTVFPRIYREVYELLVDDAPILVQGQLQKDENALKVLADSVIAMEKAEETWTAAIHFNLDLSRLNTAELKELNELFKRHPGNCRAFIHLQDAGKFDTIIALPESIRLMPGRALGRDVSRLLGYPAVEMVCSVATNGSAMNQANNHYRGNGK